MCSSRGGPASQPTRQVVQCVRGQRERTRVRSSSASSANSATSPRSSMPTCSHLALNALMARTAVARRLPGPRTAVFGR